MQIPINDQLTSLLLKYGFKEVTEKKDPERWEYFQKVGYYIPSSMKRYFDKGRIHIYLDNGRFNASYQTVGCMDKECQGLTNIQLASILYFSTINTSDRQYLNGLSQRNIFNIYDQLESHVKYERDREPFIKNYKPAPCIRLLNELNQFILEVGEIFNH